MKERDSNMKEKDLLITRKEIGEEKDGSKHDFVKIRI